ncbi:DUF554 domain-containing protein [Paenalkalicoccus suaedae]|uniref:DUF554 domain-containing protein n=1 Tax=Paenalkalicoccus suaedae TaxID=2592382 RepID=A0A859FJY4_9BACI|nr:DUF554 domain-containing protein [Paenalkalicoccus suaedae]QKS73108.1 DUF554 domain-containing protein [Paenalkalicoccus suaedae]
MVLFGTIVNGLAIVVGALIGVRLKHFSPSMQETVMKGIGLAVLVLGFSMALEGTNMLYVIISLAIGSVIGERISIEGKLNELGGYMERKWKRNENDRLSEGFVAATLLYVVGAMAIIGALDSGFRQDHSVLLTKSMLDGFSAIIFSATLGIGVLFSAIPVVLYQGSIALAATLIIQWIPEELLQLFIAELTAVGGVMIIGIATNLLGITSIRVANMLPAIPVIIFLVLLQSSFF